MNGDPRAVIIAELLNFAFDALAHGLERDAIVSKAKEMEAAGATPVEISAAIKQMRDDAIKAAQDEIDRMP